MIREMEDSHTADNEADTTHGLEHSTGDERDNPSTIKPSFGQDLGKIDEQTNELSEGGAEPVSREDTPTDLGESDKRHSDFSWHAHQNLSLEGYLTHYQHRSPSRRALPFHGMNIGSTQTSASSLQALSEHEGEDTTLKRAHSTRSTRSRHRGRSVSQTKALSVQPGSKRSLYGESFYPDQSYAQLSNPVLGSRPHPVLRTRSSHPAQNALYNDPSKPSVASPQGRRTTDNTPMSSPGLFTPTAVRQATLDSSRSGSPSLHHLQAPKETHTAEIEHDVYSGNKFINNYEVVTELGRGEHGKVKLGRDIERDTMVAIKIVPRYSAKRRLGKLGAPEDRTKREVAILKKARHPNVVSLLEVIDDPNKNKVYLILEFVDRGEIKWRKGGVKEILAINNVRFEQEKLGALLSNEPTDRDFHIVRQAQIRHERLEQLQTHHKDLNHIPNWSLEYAGDTDDESEMLEMSRTISRQWTKDSMPSRGNSQDDYVGMYEPSLTGSMYGAYAPDAYRARKFSVAASAISHMSSDIGFEQDDDQRSYVPALTMEEAQRAFRDTLVGLEFLHFIGIIHRDIKPANLLASSTQMVKISDFGVSYLGRPENEEETEEQAAANPTVVDSEKELARSVGTPAFWAPELCYDDVSLFEDGKEPKITGALDLWALGITLYCMIYARLPFYSNDDMGLHEAICTAEVFCPRSRLVPVDTTSAEFISQSQVPINGNKRLDYELKFEAVPDAVRDLIGKLLIKDPAKRITIAEAKRHPWVFEGVTDEIEWLQGPIEKEGKKKILEVNEKELNHAVVKRNIIERALTTAGRLAGSLLGRKDGRKRASSAATSAGSSTESLHSPSGSTTSTVGKPDRLGDVRRKSLRGDEFVQALKSSREPGEHPLAQSQTASPEGKLGPGYFDTPKSASTGATPLENERRPRGPDRAISALSTAESVKTIRASQPRSEGHMEPTIRSKFEGLWEGTTKSLARLASRDGRGASRSRSASRPTSESDGHAGPSLALSNMHAAGAITTPNELEASDPVSTLSSPLSPHSPSHVMIHAPASSDVEFEQAQHINQRRHLQEIQDKIDTVEKRVMSSAPKECPPSPDDLTYLETSEPLPQHVSPPGGAMQTAASASTIASSIDGFGDGSVSDPSYGIASGASSPPEAFLSAEYKDLPKHDHTANEPDFMRTADTITTSGGAITAPAKALEVQHECYNGEDVDDEDSDEEGIVMGGPKRR